MGAATTNEKQMGWNKTPNMNNEDNSAEDMSTELDFDLDGVEAEEARSFELMPRGFQPAVVSGFKKKSNDKGWRGVELKATIIAGQFKGRGVWGNFTTHHSDMDEKKQKSVKIGRGQIKAAFAAAGVGGNDLADLVGAEEPIMISVGHETYNGNTKNTLAGFRAMTDKERAMLDSDGEEAPAEPAKKKSFLGGLNKK